MITLNDIYQKVCHVSGVDILIDTRKQEVCDFRQIFMFLARELTSSTYEVIGGYVGKDHTTAMHACKKKVPNMLQTENDMKEIYKEIYEQIKLDEQIREEIKKNGHVKKYMRMTKKQLIEIIITWHTKSR